MTTIELKDCPCCGCFAKLQEHGHGGYRIWCEMRTADNPSSNEHGCGLSTRWHGTLDAAAAAWNRRASPWKPIGEAICDDRDVLVYLDNGQTCGQFVFNLDHDSDPHYWRTRHNITHFAELPEDPPSS